MGECVSNIQVGDRVSTGQPKVGVGVVRAVWGPWASVDFPGGSRHVLLAELESEDEKARRREAVRAAAERAKRAEQDQERLRLRAAAIAELTSAMERDFLGVDELYRAQHAGVLEPEGFLEAKAEFVRNWVAHDLAVAGAHANAPDVEQSAAIASVHGNVQVVARAGSGKTTTLVSRAVFLLKHCGAAPSELLLLAFNRKAAQEMRKSLLIRLVPEAAAQIKGEIERIRRQANGRRAMDAEVDADAVEAVAEQFAGRLPHVMTFHALAHAIVHPEGRILFDGQDADSLGLSRAVQDVIDGFMRGAEHSARVRDLMMEHFREDWDRIVDGGFNLGMEDMLALKRSLPRETLGGELVKSRGEKVIADFLFERGIPYKYERNHWWSGVNYKPDFTIFTGEKQGVVIEYFGMAGNAEYDRLTEQKQEYWAGKMGWSLVSLFPRDLAAGNGEAFSQALAAELQARGIECRRLGEDEIWQRVRHRAVDRFTRAMSAFVGRCRKKSWSAADLAERVEAHVASTATESSFLELAAEFFAEYLRRLDETGEDDFDGLMQKAAEAVESGSTLFLRRGGGGDIKSLRFVCVDEYQDFSDLFQRLVEAMRGANARLSFFCVGDDWQAINGFAGSELKFFERFADWFGNPIVLNISTNYRSARSIVEIGNALMAGRGQPARASKAEHGDAWLCDISEFEPSLVEKQRHPGDLVTPLAARLAHRFAAEGRKVVFLARRNGIPWYFNTGDDASRGRGLDDFLMRVRSCLPKDLRAMAGISTAHKFKGLERPAVVVLDAVDRSYPLIHPDWPFFRLFGDGPQTLAEDDRRLFYVALTRAVESLVVVTDAAARSPFLDQIASRRPLSKLPWKSFPPVAEGSGRRLIVKVKDAAGKAFGGNAGTYPIKGVLRECRYQYHGGGKLWEKSIPQERFNMEAIQSEAWVEAARDVVASFHDEDETLLASYRIDEGCWATIFERWDLMQIPSPDAKGGDLVPEDV